MPLKKIRELGKEETCISPEHNPPKHIVLKPGVYEWECPSCGRKIEFVVQGHSWKSFSWPINIKSHL